MATPDVKSKNNLYQMGDNGEWARIGNAERGDLTVRISVSSNEDMVKLFGVMPDDKEEPQIVSIRYKPSNLWFAPEIICRDVRASGQTWDRNIATATFRGESDGAERKFAHWWHRPIWWAYRTWKKIKRK